MNDQSFSRDLIRFKQFFLAEAEYKSHMTHIEDLVLYGGVDGIRRAILTLKHFKDNLIHGNATSENVDVTTKWDGSPAVFFGIDPEDGQFFVAKKSIFNKNPKVYKTVEDIKADTSGDLADKLILALQELPKLGVEGIAQGDFLYSRSDLSTKTIDGKKWITFHPNTLVYAIPNDSPLAETIRKSKIGIVIHTSYSGRSFSELKPKFGFDIKTLRKTPSVWVASANYDDMSNLVGLKPTTHKELTELLSSAGRIFRNIGSSVLKKIEDDSELARMFEKYNNSRIRAGKQMIENPKKHVDGLIEFVRADLQKKVDALKSVAGKQKKQTAMDEFMSFFSPENKEKLIQLFELQSLLAKAKMIVVKKLAEIESYATFVLTPNGYELSAPEGFVAIDNKSGQAVKLVDRMTFSYNNFSPDIVKGWESDRRYMKEQTNALFEFADRPVSYVGDLKMHQKDDYGIKGFAAATFKVADGEKEYDYQVIFSTGPERESKSGEFYRNVTVAFYDGAGSTSISRVGQKVALRVFSAVVQIIKEFIVVNNYPKVLIFSASLQDGARASLYSKLSKKFASDNYDVELTKNMKTYHTDFTLIHRSLGRPV